MSRASALHFGHFMSLFYRDAGVGAVRMRFHASTRLTLAVSAGECTVRGFIRGNGE
jgi:hypothetical protein